MPIGPIGKPENQLRRETGRVLHGETGRRLRAAAAVLVLAILNCVGLASTAGAAGARHYEQVSPVEKGQGDVVGDGEATIAGRLGDAVAFSSRTPFGDEIGSGASGQTVYVARRGSGGWASHSVTPAERTDVVQTVFLPTRVDTFSDDLSSAVVWGYDLPGGGGPPDRSSIYYEDTATRALQPLTLSQVDPLGPFDFFPANVTVWGVSADARHVAFVTSTQLLSDAAPGVSNVYEWDAGRGLSVAGVLPDGTVPAGGSDVQPNDYRAAMSADGTRLVFTAAPNGVPELYMRIDGRTTVPISQPAGFPDSINVSLQAVTPDGRNVFFMTDSPLVPGSDRNSGPDLYRWTDGGDAAHDGTLTPISTTGDVGVDTLSGVIGTSDDGTRVYYQTTSNQIIVWNNGTSRVINSDAVEDPNPRASLAAVASQPGLGRVTPDGMWLAFMSFSTLHNDGVHSLTGQVSNGNYEMYVYSLRDDSLNCVSCPRGAAAPNASVTPDVTSGTPVLFDAAIRPRFLSDGGQVFFSTTAALVPEDVNGVEDVYEYDAPTGTLRLVSTGTGKSPASFADAGASGGDVFIETRQQLASGDRDNLVDMYDATTRPPLPIAPATPATDCQGDTCQPPPSASPPDDPFGSASLDGNGNGVSAGKALRIPSGVAARGSVASVHVRLLASGALSWRGTGVLSRSTHHGRGAFTVRVQLDRRARVQLKTKGRYVTRIRLTLVLPDGTRVSGTSRVTFSAAPKKGR